MESWIENYKIRWFVWNSVIYWFYKLCVYLLRIYILKNSWYLNVSEKRIKLLIRNINFVGWNLFYEKYKMYVYVIVV